MDLAIGPMYKLNPMFTWLRSQGLSQAHGGGGVHTTYTVKLEVKHLLVFHKLVYSIYKEFLK